jgi:hypothetical protein
VITCDELAVSCSASFSCLDRFVQCPIIEFKVAYTTLRKQGIVFPSAFPHRPCQGLSSCQRVRHRISHKIEVFVSSTDKIK